MKAFFMSVFAVAFLLLAAIAIDREMNPTPEMVAQDKALEVATCGPVDYKNGVYYFPMCNRSTIAETLSSFIGEHKELEAVYGFPICAGSGCRGYIQVFRPVKK